MTVKTDQAHRFNVPVVLPAVGFKIVNANGEFEHDCKEEVDELISHYPDFYYDSEEDEDDLGEDLDEDKGEDIKEKSEEDQIGGSDENELANKEAEEAATKAAMIETLNVKTRKELEELCATFPSAEWRGKNKAELVEYLTGKLA